MFATLANSLPTPLRNLLARVGMDFEARGRPNIFLVAVAIVAASISSIGADIVLVKLGVRFLHAPKNYSHFVFSDFATLTVIGVVGAGFAWPFVAGLSSRAQFLYRNLAILVTLVLLAPDAYIWLKGEPLRCVTVLVGMHLAIGVVTYLIVVSVAPIRRLR